MEAEPQALQRDGEAQFQGARWRAGQPGDFLEAQIFVMAQDQHQPQRLGQRGDSVRHQAVDLAPFADRFGCKRVPDRLLVQECERLLAAPTAGVAGHIERNAIKPGAKAPFSR